MRYSAALIAVFVTACSEPRCPSEFVQRGDVCKRCPAGSAPVHNECVDQDSGAMVEPVDDDGGRRAETAHDASSDVSVDGSPSPSDGGLPSEDAMASRSENLPTFGGFSTLGAARKNGADGTSGVLVLSDDGFDLGTTGCNANGACLTGSISP